MGIFNLIANAIISSSVKRAPDFVIGEPDAPYLMRWYLWPRNRWANAYLHKFLQGDDPRALHDHPWVNCSIVLRGVYLEHMQNGRMLRRERGAVVLRRSVTAHRIALLEHPRKKRDLGLRQPPEPAWSLFITGPVVRSWGFHCPKGWRHWKDFTGFREVGESGRGRIGKGCD